MAMSDKMRSIEDMISPLMRGETKRSIGPAGASIVSDDGMRIKTSPKKEEGSITAKEVEVTGDFENQLMKMYQDALEQGYKGSFEEYLIDISLGGEEFDPSSPMKVSKLPEGIMQLMNMMKDRKTA